jgi:transcriptional regulator with XRE-family HTH domain
MPTAPQENLPDLTGRASLTALLRAWRRRAGRQLGHRRPLTQRAVAQRAQISERWYRALETGRPVRRDPARLHRLADALQLDHTERATLHLTIFHALPPQPPTPLDGYEAELLHDVLSQHTLNPAVLTDHTWEILTYNAAALKWFPGLTPGVNVAHWITRDPDARFWLADWHTAAHHVLGLLRYALVRYPDDNRLVHLVNDALRDPDCLQLWHDHPTVLESPDGLHTRLRLPFHATRRIITVRTHLLHPAVHPTHHLAILVPVSAADETEPVPAHQ